MEMDSFFDGGKEEEQALLEILRSSRSKKEIRKTCLLLADHGTIYSLPVLAARMVDTTMDMKEIFLLTTEMILKNHNVPIAQWSDFCDPNQWHSRWTGPPESFLAFVEIFSMAEPDASKRDEVTDRLGEIFMKVIEVDLSPYQSFRELRICAKEGYLEPFVQAITEQIQSQVMVYDLLDEVSIHHIKVDIDKELYQSLQLDYMNTRLRQYIKFTSE